MSQLLLLLLSRIWQWPLLGARDDKVRVRLVSSEAVATLAARPCLGRRGRRVRRRCVLVP